MGQEQQGNCHRLALLACQLDAKCHMVNCLLFRKEDDFCSTFPSSCQPANIHIIGQMAHSFFRKLLSDTKYCILSNKLKVYHLY